MWEWSHLLVTIINIDLYMVISMYFMEYHCNGVWHRDHGEYDGEYDGYDDGYAGYDGYSDEYDAEYDEYDGYIDGYDDG